MGTDVAKLKEAQDLVGVNLNYLVPSEKVPCTIFLYFQWKFLESIRGGELLSLDLFFKMKKNFLGSGFIRKEDLPRWEAWKSSRHPQSGATSISAQASSADFLAEKSKGKAKSGALEFLNYALGKIEVTARSETELNQMKEAQSALKAALSNQMIGWYFERESDPLIWGHTSRVAYLSLLFSAFSLAAVPSDFMDLLATAAIIHEVESDPSRPRQKGEAASRTVTFLQGKGIAIPMNILEIVMQQDEAFDGSGMPKKLKGQKITLHARVMALVDGFDHFRLQHPGGTRRVRFERTRSLMQETSSRYDPDLWNLFWPFMETVEIFD